MSGFYAPLSFGYEAKGAKFLYGLLKLLGLLKLARVAS
jgi:hypothetical protein